MKTMKGLYIKFINGDELTLEVTDNSHTCKEFVFFAIDENNYANVVQFLNDRDKKEIVFTVNPKYYNADLYLNKDNIVYAEIQQFR